MAGHTLCNLFIHNLHLLILNLLLLLLLLLFLLNLFSATPATASRIRGTSGATWTCRTRGRLTMVTMVVAVYIRDYVRAGIAAVTRIRLKARAGVKGTGWGRVVVVRVIMVQGVGNVIVMGVRRRTKAREILQIFQVKPSQRQLTDDPG